MSRVKIVVDYEPETGYIFDSLGGMYMTSINNSNFEEYKEAKNTNSLALTKAIEKYTAAEVIALHETGAL